MKRFLLMLTMAALGLGAGARVTLPSLIGHGMVLQRNQPVPLWGWAEPGEQVAVTLGKKHYEATADEDGCWRIDLPKMKAGGPYELAINDTILKEVYIGDVWLCSGQSNVDIHLERVYPQYPDEIDSDANEQIRLFQVRNVANTQGPQPDVRSDGWKMLAKENAWHFSALGYFLAKQMFRQTGVPQGVIQSSWGGTPIEAWLPTDSMAIFNPIGVRQTRLFQDLELAEAANAFNNLSNSRWQQVLDDYDPGVAQRWMDPDLDDSAWLKVEQDNLPSGEWPFCGSYWLRQHFTADSAHALLPATLLLGTLYDADVTYLNGKEVGRTYYQYPPRRYHIPQGLIRPGDNVIAVRFINKNGWPSFYKDKPYCIEFDRESRQPLANVWLAHDGVQMPVQPFLSCNVQNMASTLWNGMLHGLAPFRLAGVVWYQGESNTGQPAAYEPLLACLMHSWRKLFQQPELPFTVVQLANYMEPSALPQNSGWARLRESQRRAVERDGRAELAVAIDLGEASDIHPLKKKELAERCVLAFNRTVFGKDVKLSPALVGASVAGDNLVLTFDQPLQAGSVDGFELASGEGSFRSVSARAEGTSVVIRVQGRIARVRYAWKDNPAEANLRSADGKLPAVPFEHTLETK